MFFHSATSVYWPSGFDADTFDEQAEIMAPARGNRIADPRLLAPHDTLVLNVLPQGGSPALSGAGTPPAGFDTTATYCGALGTGDWTVGWTAYPP